MACAEQFETEPQAVTGSAEASAGGAHPHDGRAGAGTRMGRDSL